MDAGDPMGAGEHEDLIRAAMEEFSEVELAATPTEPAKFSESSGQLIDRYRLIEEVGEGGMGVVWRAEQLAPVERIVALKVVKRGMDTREVTTRFEQERAALARLSHPNIATVLDGGSTASGRPYFAMEFVAGAPIVAASDRMRLDVKARIRLMVVVCGAIEHAHGNGIIHRDIKSSNILLPGYAEHSAIGQPLVPKVIDFGIAKALRGETEPSDLVTRQQQVVGTLTSMAPEQADGRQIDARTDVYALGTLLYELVSGALPFAQSDLEASGYEQALRHIREVRPPLASSAVAGEEAASNRSTTPVELRRTLHRDMDWVIARALEKEPSRRYPTATALRLDLERYLQGRPVEARPASWAYLSGKFIQRHRGLTVGVSMAMLALLLGLIATSVALRRANSADRATRRTLYFAESLLACDAALAPGGAARVAELSGHWAEPSDGAVDWRGWEWFYLDSTLRPDVLRIETKSAPCGVAWHPDGERLAVARNQGVDVYESRTGARVGGWDSKAAASAGLFEGIAWDPTGRVVAAAGLGGMILVEPMAERLLWSYSAGYISGPTWSPAGDRILGYGVEGEKDDLLFEFDPATGKPTRRLSAGYHWMGCFGFSPDGLRLTSAKAPGRCVILDAQSYEPLLSVGDHTSVLTAARWGHDDSVLATAGFDGRVCVWDMEQQALALALDPFREAVRGLDWHPNGQWLATGCDDKLVNVWDAMTGEHRAELSGHTKRVDRVAWSPSGDRLASTSQDGTVRVWSLDVPSPHRSIATAESDERAARAALTWLPGGGALLVASSLGAVTVPLDQSPSGERVFEGGRACAIAGTNGRFVATSTEAGGQDRLELSVSDPSFTPSSSHTWSFPWKPNFNHVPCAWHPTESRLAYFDGEALRVADFKAGASPVELHSMPLDVVVLDLEWDPSGKRLGAISADATVSVIDLEAVSRREVFRRVNANLYDVVWSPDGQHLASCTGGGEVFTVRADGGGVRSLAGHAASVQALAWHPSGSRLASASRDGTVVLWDTDTGQLAAKLLEADPVLALSWDATGARLAAVTDRGMLHIWDASISLGSLGNSAK